MRRLGPRGKQRQYTTITGLTTGLGVVCFDNTITNCAKAIHGRVLTRQVRGIRRSVMSFVPYFEEYNVGKSIFERKFDDKGLKKLVKFSNELKGFLSIVAPLSRVSFADNYGGRKKERYLAASKLFEERGIIAKDFVIKCFIKYEKGFDQSKIPRVISPAGDVALVEIGRHVRPHEHVIYEALNAMMGYTVVAKGLNYDQLATVRKEAWDSFEDPVAFDLDVEKLDASVLVYLLKWVHEIELACHTKQDQSYLRELLKQQLHTVGRGKARDGYFSYKVDGTLNSGSPNTSLVAILIVVGILYPILSQRKARLINMGDDCSLVLSKRNTRGLRKDLEKAFREHGMEITLSDPIREYCKTEFCKLVNLQYDRFTRSVKLPRAFSKETTLLLNLRVPHLIAGWFVQVGKGGMATHGGIPVFHSYYNKMIEAGKKYLKGTALSGRQRKRANTIQPETSFNDWSKGVSYKDSVITDGARVAFYEAFGVTPGDQTLIEHEITSLEIDFKEPGATYPLLNLFSEVFT